jgi:hypothetical protein
MFALQRAEHHRNLTYTNFRQSRVDESYGFHHAGSVTVHSNVLRRGFMRLGAFDLSSLLPCRSATTVPLIAN